MQKAWTFNSIAPAAEGAAPDFDFAGKNQPWRRGLFQCFSDIGMCCCVLWCTPCTVGQVASIVRGGAAWLPPYCGERGSRTDLAKTRRVPRFRLHEGSEMNLPKLLHELQQFKGAIGRANPLFVTPGW